MSAADVPIRKVVKRLTRRLDALSATLGALAAQIQGVDRFKIVETALEVETGDFSKYELLIIVADEDNEAPGLFRRKQDTTQPLDGVEAIQDLGGAKFERFVLQ